MRMIFDDRTTGGATRQGEMRHDPTFTLLGSAMASGLCLDLMIERLLDSAAGERR